MSASIDISEYVTALEHHASEFNRRREELEAGQTPRIITAAEMMHEMPKPRGWEWCDDQTLAFHYLSIREIGWELFARGGTDLMSRVCDELYDRKGTLGSCVEHRWEMIGVAPDVWLP